MGSFISDAAKRTLDLLCVVLGGPFVLAIAAYTRHRIKKDSPGDAIYSGKRLGKNGALFPCYKFRSMYTNGDEILEQYYLEHPEKKAEYEKYHKLDAYDFIGRRYDVGDKQGYLEAQVEYALRRDDLAERFSQYLKNLVFKA